MLSPIDLIINKFAQGLIDLNFTQDWFETHENKREIITWLRQYVEQSHPNEEVLKTSILTMPIEQSMTPIVLLKTNKPLRNALMAINKLPENEMKKSFVVLLWLFKTSDTYRREHFCKGNYQHEWHNLVD